MALIRLQNITKQFNQSYALQYINIDIQAGEFLVLVGPSGCGKSTLLRILSGLEQPSSGHILFEDRNITQWSPRERNFSLIFQNYALFPHMTVEQNITFGMRIRKEPKQSFPERVERVANMLQLKPLLTRKPKELSGGQRQRVAMARAIVRDPDLFLMDEPLSNLDAKLRVEVRDGIMQMHQQIRTSTVYVTHDQIEAMTMADRIAVLDKGQLQQIGTPEQLYRHPVNLFVATFIGTPAMNIIELPFHQGAALLQEQLIPLPKTVSSYQEAHIYLGIRPEHISDEPLPPGRCGFQIQGTVIGKELHGAEYLIQMMTSIGRIEFRKKNQGPIAELHSMLTLTAETAHLYFFSIKTKLNLLRERE